MVPMDTNTYDYYELKIAGIESSDFNTAVVFSGYVSNGEEIYYVNNGESGNEAIPASYNQLLNRVNGKLPSEE